MCQSVPRLHTQETYTRMSTAVLFNMETNWKQGQCPPAGKGNTEVQCIFHTIPHSKEKESIPATCNNMGEPRHSVNQKGDARKDYMQHGTLFIKVKNKQSFFRHAYV